MSRRRKERKAPESGITLSDVIATLTALSDCGKAARAAGLRLILGRMSTSDLLDVAVCTSVLVLEMDAAGRGEFGFSQLEQLALAMARGEEGVQDPDAPASGLGS